MRYRTGERPMSGDIVRHARLSKEYRVDPFVGEPKKMAPVHDLAKGMRWVAELDHMILVRRERSSAGDDQPD